MILTKNKKQIDENKDENLFNTDIHRIGYSDILECDGCSQKGDTQYMKQHFCYNKN